MSLHLPSQPRLRSQQTPSRCRTSNCTSKAPAPLLTWDQRYENSFCNGFPCRRCLCCGVGMEQMACCTHLMESLLLCSVTCCTPWAMAPACRPRLVCHAEAAAVPDGGAGAAGLPPVSVLGAPSMTAPHCCPAVLLRAPVSYTHLTLPTTPYV